MGCNASIEAHSDADSQRPRCYRAHSSTKTARSTDRIHADESLETEWQPTPATSLNDEAAVPFDEDERSSDASDRSGGYYTDEPSPAVATSRLRRATNAARAACQLRETYASAADTTTTYDRSASGRTPSASDVRIRLWLDGRDHVPCAVAPLSKRTSLPLIPLLPPCLTHAALCAQERRLYAAELAGNTITCHDAAPGMRPLPVPGL